MARLREEDLEVVGSKRRPHSSESSDPSPAAQQEEAARPIIVTMTDENIVL